MVQRARREGHGDDERHKDIGARPERLRRVETKRTARRQKEPIRSKISEEDDQQCWAETAEIRRNRHGGVQGHEGLVGTEREVTEPAEEEGDHHAERAMAMLFSRERCRVARSASIQLSKPHDSW